MKKVGIIGLVVVLLVVILGGIYAYVDPNKRVQGLVHNEPTYNSRPASAWLTDFQSADENTRTLAAKQLKEGGADAVPVLEVLLKTEGPAGPRFLAADTLGQIGAPARPAGPALIAALKDSDSTVKAVAAKSLGKLAPEVPGAVPALVGNFPSIEAIRAVSDFGPAAGEAIPALIGLLTNSDATVRWQAARALQKIGPTAAVAIPDIIKQLKDEDGLVREHAAEALGFLGPTATVAIPDVVKVLDDKVWRVRRDAVRTLGGWGPAAKDALLSVQKLKNDPEQQVKDAATKAERLIDPSLAGKDKPAPDKAAEKDRATE
ncbi:HEAT repeat domain-containing protein [Fimbriiglobus ruber]|uniref:HEAT-repeat-containing PBS lyase n=1 Tax=Fimbriiglobus ruber TaxID=1908690 RepID=A0A225E3N1_9BACT|nr:HEAT repeat domain-containing protein [Fimbriiglobus ruber]OWK46364.1 HEAT-repeat-containing PBS lyase [Fimbriiglobus ruber]